MINYTGSTCLICNEKFKNGDDIVVCPDCGTPYHRSCWAKENRCINTTLHETGASWQQQRREKAEAEAQAIIDQNRGTSSQQVRIELPGGQSMFFDAADPCCGMSPEEPMEGEKLGDVANFVQKNTLYYIPLFRRFRDTGKKLSLNFTCVLFPQLYFAYRKMWGLALLSVVLLLVCDIPSLLLSQLTMLTNTELMQQFSTMYGMDLSSMFGGLTAFLQAHEAFLSTLSVPLYLLNLLVRALLCLFGNYLYFRFVIKSVNRIRSHAATPQLRNTLLRTEGGTNLWNVIGCAALGYLAQFLFIYAVMLLCQMAA